MSTRFYGNLAHDFGKIVKRQKLLTWQNGMAGCGKGDIVVIRAGIVFGSWSAPNKTSNTCQSSGVLPLVVGRGLSGIPMDFIRMNSIRLRLALEKFYSMFSKRK